ncbi:hypothetical protein [Calidifontibacter indicus]|uniref:hypothetical protein n=1 Tax=Calidifontibacter indicus TaxID=419650 RepID=UPI003D72F900
MQQVSLVRNHLPADGLGHGGLMRSTATLEPNPSAPGVPRLTVDGDRVDIDTGQGTRSLALAEVGIACFTYAIRNSQTAGLVRHNVMIETRDGRPLAWLGNADVVPYAPGALAGFAAQAGLPLRDLGEIPYSAVRAFPDEVLRVGPGTSRAGSMVAPLRQWILCLTLIAGATPLALSIAQKWSLWWWLLLVPFWFFGSFFAVGALQAGAGNDRSAIGRTRVKVLVALVVTIAAAAVGVLGYQGRGPVPGWLGLWVAAGGLVLVSGWTLALHSMSQRSSA